MSKFSIDTDSVDNVADDINSLLPKASSIKSSVSGYDVSNPDGFDFSGAKAAIAHNIEGVETKINNTVKLLNAVVGTHSGLQNSVGDSSGSVSPTSNSSSSSNYSSGSYSYGGYGSGDYSSGRGGAYYAGGSYGNSGGTGYTNASSTYQNTQASSQANNIVAEVEEVSTNSDKDSILDYDPFSVFSDKDLSAAELLDIELSATATFAASAVSSLLLEDEEIEDKKTSARVIKADEIVPKSQSQSIIVLETDGKEKSDYSKIVKEVATENGIGFYVLMLDSIIETKSFIGGLNIELSNAIETNAVSAEEKSTELVLNELKKVNTDEISTLNGNLYKNAIESESIGIDEIENIKLEEKTKEVNPIDENDYTNGIKSIAIEENELEKISTEEDQNDKSVLSVLYKRGEDTGLSDIIEEEEKNKRGNLPYTIINQKDYDTLMNIPTSSTAHNDLKITPVTLIIRNGVIIYSVNGETTKDSLNQAIQSLGIGKSNIIK